MVPDIKVVEKPGLNNTYRPISGSSTDMSGTKIQTQGEESPCCPFTESGWTRPCGM